MGIESLYADGIEQAYRRGLSSPAQPVEPDFRMGSFLAAGLSGIPRGAFEALSSVRDLAASSEQQFRDSPRGRIVAQEYERRTGVKPADQYRMPGGDSMRQAAEYRLGPDPQTAHVADQVFHGLTRFGTKAVGAVAAAGPVGGAALLGAEETNTIYRDLIGRGIDSETALKVAAVQGAISAAGVMLPISAAGLPTAAGKVAGTAALVGVGGPGGYVAQETLARDILQRAGYADEAAKHDPTDPLGLGISTILPLAFGGAAVARSMRSTKPMPPVRTEAGVRQAVQLTPEEQAASDAYEASAANLAELRKEIARQKDPAARQVLEAELAKQTQAAATLGQNATAEAAARSPAVVDAARVKVLQETVRRSLPETPDAYPRLMEAIDAVAAGDRPVVEAITQVQQWQSLAATAEDAAARAGDDSPEMDALRGRARQIAADIYDGDRTLAQYEAEVQPLSPVMRRLVQEAQQDAPTTPQAPYPEAAAPAGGTRDGAATAASDAGRPAADVQAAGVARTERQIVEALAAERPDMLVTLPGTNEAVPLADALEQIRAQQALDENDADLVRAAVLCDLSP